MQKIAQLLAAGYSIQPAVDAVDCTELSSPSPFWFYNPNFVELTVRNFGELKFATVREGRYRVVAAGNFTQADEFPFSVISLTQYEKMKAAQEKYFLHRNEAASAEDDFITVGGA